MTERKAWGGVEMTVNWGMHPWTKGIPFFSEPYTGQTIVDKKKKSSVERKLPE